jgi:predicted small lipoprotein YifL
MSTYVGPTATPRLGGRPAGAPNFARRRLMAGLIAAALAATVVVALSTLGAGGRVGPLDWSGDAEVFTHPTLPGDRVLTARLRNDGLHPLRVDIGDVRLLDGDGHEVASSPVFLQAFGKSLWAAGRGPVQEPDSELQRTGRIALLEPGEEVPLTVAWRTRDGEPARLDYGRGSLSLPG